MKPGDIVQVIRRGQIYSTYSDMFLKYNFKNIEFNDWFIDTIHMSPALRNLSNVWEIVDITPHGWNITNLLAILKNVGKVPHIRGSDLVIGIEGVKTILKLNPYLTIKIL